MPVDSAAAADEPWKYVRDPPEGSPWALTRPWEPDLPGGTHVRFGWSNANDDCEFWVEGLADLDGDGVYSTYVEGNRFSDKKKTRRVDIPENPEWREPSDD